MTAKPDDVAGGASVCEQAVAATVRAIASVSRTVFIEREGDPAARTGGGVYAGEASPTIPSIPRAMSRSFSVIPPSECVTNAKVTVRQRISISGW